MILEINPQTIVTTINSCVCLGIMWSSLCRLAISHANVVKSVRAHAALALGSALVSLMSPAFGYQVTWGQLMLGTTMLISMLMTSWRFRFGPKGDLLIIRDNS